MEFPQGAEWRWPQECCETSRREHGKCSRAVEESAIFIKSQAKRKCLFSKKTWLLIVVGWCLSFYQGGPSVHSCARHSLSSSDSSSWRRRKAFPKNYWGASSGYQSEAAWALRRHSLMEHGERENMRYRRIRLQYIFLQLSVASIITSKKEFTIRVLKHGALMYFSKNFHDSVIGAECNVLSR